MSETGGYSSENAARVKPEAQHWEICLILWTDGTGRETHFLPAWENNARFVLWRAPFSSVRNDAAADDELVSWHPLYACVLEVAKV